MELDIKRGTKGLVTAPGVLRLAEDQLLNLVKASLFICPNSWHPVQAEAAGILKPQPGQEDGGPVRAPG